MNLLLDTHALLWWLDDSPELSNKARKAIADEANAVYVSAASVWEISIKRALGKLQTPPGLLREIERHRFSPLSISLPHAHEVERLPHHHADPFDRMLIAQARLEKLTLVTRDRNIRRYRVARLEA